MNELSTTHNSIDHKNFFYPPGGILLWIIIALELLTFGIALVVMAFSYKDERQIFHQSASLLNTTIGSANTLILLTSGYCIAASVQRFRQQLLKQSNYFLHAGLAMGLAFIILKTIEYAEKIKHGYALGYNTFFDFYWLLTGFHLVHVIAGMVILWWIRKVQKPKPYDRALLDFESGAAFWHLCDIIWLLLFPVLYLTY